MKCQLLLYFSKGSPICFLLVGTLNPIKYCAAVIIHFAFARPLITYKIRWELWIPVNLLEVITHQQRSHQQVKPKYNKRAHTNGRKGNPRTSRQDQRDHTTESHRIPTIEVHPTKTACKAEHQITNKKTQLKWRDKERTCNPKDWKSPH